MTSATRITHTQGERLPTGVYEGAVQASASQVLFDGFVGPVTRGSVYIADYRGPLSLGTMPNVRRVASPCLLGFGSQPNRFWAADQTALHFADLADPYW